MPKPGYKQSKAHVAKRARALRGWRKKGATGWLSGEGDYRVRSDGSRKVYEQRLVLEKKLGRKLRPSEIVHHADGDKLHNAPGNLRPMSRAKHNKQRRKK